MNQNYAILISQIEQGDHSDGIVHACVDAYREDFGGNFLEAIMNVSRRVQDCIDAANISAAKAIMHEGRKERRTAMGILNRACGMWIPPGVPVTIVSGAKGPRPVYGAPYAPDGKPALVGVDVGAAWIMAEVGRVLDQMPDPSS